MPEGSETFRHLRRRSCLSLLTLGVKNRQRQIQVASWRFFPQDVSNSSAQGLGEANLRTQEELLQISWKKLPKTNAKLPQCKEKHLGNAYTALWSSERIHSPRDTGMEIRQKARTATSLPFIAGQGAATGWVLWSSELFCPEGLLMPPRVIHGAYIGLWAPCLCWASMGIAWEEFPRCSTSESHDCCETAS